MSNIATMVEQFAAGRLSRRELVWGLTALMAAAATGRSDTAYAQQRSSTFQALGLNHLALRVTDLDRSQAFYERHLGMTRIMSGVASPPFDGVRAPRPEPVQGRGATDGSRVLHGS